MIETIKKLIRNFLPKTNNYVGKMDEFLQNFDKKNKQLSVSQADEIEKYKRIYQYRDEAGVGDTVVSKNTWKDF